MITFGRDGEKKVVVVATAEKNFRSTGRKGINLISNDRCAYAYLTGFRINGLIEVA